MTPQSKIDTKVVIHEGSKVTKKTVDGIVRSNEKKET
jgi:hypothetical protein